MKRRKPVPPNGPSNLKKHGFTNALWRLEERDSARKTIADRNIDEVAWRIERWRWTAEYVRNAGRRGGGVPPSAIDVWAPHDGVNGPLVKVRWDINGEVRTIEQGKDDGRCSS